MDLTEMIGQLLTGRYLILKTLGAGGFSETYLARDKYLPHHPLCVVKCFRLSAGSTISLETARRLFEVEARVMDQLGRQHTQIPTLFAYCHEQELVYQVQEYIDGENLGDWIAQNRRLTSEAAIEVLTQVLPILDYIHSHQVIHRDIKPSNLIRRHRDGKIVLIDFGAACLLSDASGQVKSDGHDALAIGTPGYMPDEQETGTSEFNSDLYALGISVIQLLTGVHPHQLKHDPISGNLDWQGHLGGRSLNPKLVTVLDGMVRSDSRNRYQQASDVLAALRSSPSTRLHASRRWFAPLKQRPVRQVLKPTVIAGLLAVMIGAGYLCGRSQQAGTMFMRLGMVSPSADVPLVWLRDLPIQGTIDRMLIVPDNRILVTAGADHSLRLWSLPTGTALRSLSGHTSTVTALNTSSNGKLLVSGSEDRTVRVWNADSGTLVRTFEGHRQAVTAVAISPDARTAVSGSKDGTLRLWDLKTGKLLRTLTLPRAEVTAVAYATAANKLISASSDRQLQVWDLRTGRLQQTLAGHTAPIMGLQVIDNHTLFSFGKDRTLVWDLNQDQLMRVFSEDSAKAVTAMLDDQRVMTVHDDGCIRVWTRNTGQLLGTVSGRLDNTLEAALSSDHRYLVSWSPEQRLQVWQLNASAIR